MRLSSMRLQLGAAAEELATFPGADTIAFDSQYLTCSLTISWAADNVVLCFAHALVSESFSFLLFVVG